MKENTRDKNTLTPATKLKNRPVKKDNIMEQIGKHFVKNPETVKEEGERRMVSVTFDASQNHLEIVYNDGELAGEELAGIDEQKQEEPDVNIEEEDYIEPLIVDPNAPYDFSDSNEALKKLFELRPDQQAEVEQLWEIYQDYTPAFTDIDNYITEKELIFMLKCLLLSPNTSEQLQELITYCVKPSHHLGHITFDKFLKMVTIRQRDISFDEELRLALQVFDPDGDGIINRDYLKEVLSKRGHKLPAKLLEDFIKEIVLTNDGTIVIEDVVGKFITDLNKEDLEMLRNTLNSSNSSGYY